MQFKILAFAFVIYNEITKKEAVLNGIWISWNIGVHKYSCNKIWKTQIEQLIIVCQNLIGL